MAAAAHCPDRRTRPAGGHPDRLDGHRPSPRGRGGDARWPGRSAGDVQRGCPRSGGGHTGRRPRARPLHRPADLRRAAGAWRLGARLPAAPGAPAAGRDGLGSARPRLRTDRRPAGAAARTARAALRPRTRPTPRPGARRRRRADRVGASTPPRRGAPRLRRADRCARDHRAVHRQAGDRARRRARDERARRPAPGPLLPARRQSHAGGTGRHGAAGVRCPAADPAAPRSDRDHRPGPRHRSDAVGRDRRRAVGSPTDGQFPRRGDRAGRLRSGRPPRQPPWRAGGLPGGAARERRAGAVGRARPRPGTGDGRRLAGPLAAAGAPAAAAGADRGRGTAARPSAGLLHLARHPPAGASRRRAGASFGEWWARDAERAAVRDYFRVEDDAGERYWIYRAGDGENAETGSHRWFLHGVFG